MLLDASTNDEDEIPSSRSFSNKIIKKSYLVLAKNRAL